MLKGTLDDFTLPDIFRLLSQSRKTGRLDVERSAGRGTVFFKDGTVYFAESTISRELIGQKLLKAQVVTDSQLMKALDGQAEGGGRIGEILLAEGIVSQEQLETALKSQIEDAVFDLLRWDAGEFDWAPGEAVEAEVSLSVSIENLVMEGSRRLDELAIITRKIPSENSVVAMAPAPPDGAAEINITPAEWRVLVLVNGQRTVVDIAEAVGSDVFATMRTLYGLASAGLVHVPGHVPVEDDDEPLPELPEPEPVVDEASAQEAEAAVAEEPVEEEPIEALADTGYHASAYEPETVEAESDSEDELGVPTAADEDTTFDAPDVNDLPSGDWFDSPEPGDLVSQTPSEAGQTEGRDPFGSEILAGAGEDQGDEPFTTEVTAELLEESFAATADEVDIPVVSAATGPAPSVDKRAAVQELSELFRQTEVDNNPTFMVPELKVDDEEQEGLEMKEPEDKHRVEDDEAITRGLISRLIDGVKGL